MSEQRLIDANALNRKPKYSFRTKCGAFPKNEYFIKADDLFSAPTIDAVPVVRCGECKYYNRNGRYNWGVCRYYSKYHNHIVDSGDYCNHGKRKEDT